MNAKGKEWIKNNWYRPVIHIIPLVILFFISITILNIWTSSIDNNASMEWNLFVTVAIFGALCWITLMMIYINKWSEYFGDLKEEYKKYLEQG